jgi:hypothetical protein
MLLCSKATPEHCHRSLVAEYLHRKWGDIEIVHQNQELARRLFPIYAAIPSCSRVLEHRAKEMPN